MIDKRSEYALLKVVFPVGKGDLHDQILITFRVMNSLIWCRMLLRLHVRKGKGSDIPPNEASADITKRDPVRK
jgi:hypothetical protein